MDFQNRFPEPGMIVGERGFVALKVPIFFKNNVMKKTKIRSIKNIWMAATVFSQSNTYQILSRNWSHVHGNVLKSRGCYRVFINRNVILFSFFSKNSFSPTLLLFRLEDTKRNALDLAEFWNQVRNYRKFLRE